MSAYAACQHPAHVGDRSIERHHVRLVSVDITNVGTSRRYARLDPTRFGLPKFVCPDCSERMKKQVHEVPGQVTLL